MTRRKPDLSPKQIGEKIDVARGVSNCDLVLKNAKYLNVFTGQWLDGDIGIFRGEVVGVGEEYSGDEVLDLTGKFIVPGFIDSHVHIESTMMTPAQYEKVVLPRGTTSAIVDPHEIVNVLGEPGFEYFLECATKSFMDIYVMLSSCVPATTHLETSGAKIGPEQLRKYKDHPSVLGLAEMMNFPGVLFKDEEVLQKLADFQDMPIDGHCPMLRGKDLNAYIVAGMHSCHESVGLEEAAEKLEKGMLVQLREGSVAKNLEDLCPVLTDYSSPRVSLATDDRNPVDILDEGHVDHMIRMAIGKGLSPATVFRSASLSAATAYGIQKRGAIAPGYFADLVVLSEVNSVAIDFVLKDGRTVSTEKDIPELNVAPPRQNTMIFETPSETELSIEGSSGKYRVIEVIPDQIITGSQIEEMSSKNGKIYSDTERDILKICVKERHGNGKPASRGLVRGFGLTKGAIGSSVGHDSHNAVVVGTNDTDMIACFDWLRKEGGGFVAIADGKVLGGIPLPIAGLMTDQDINSVYEAMSGLRTATSELGCKLQEPFLQLAFLCLPVIPDLKITDMGLVDVGKFEFVDLAL